MERSFGMIVEIILSCILVFLVPVYLATQKQDAVIQSYVQSEVSELADMVRNNGYLSKDMYEVFQKKLMATQNSYEVRMTHAHRMVNPVYGEDGSFTGKTAVSYQNFYEDDILKEILERSGSYALRQGDYFTIDVKNRNQTYSNRLQRTFLGISVDQQIHATYGGVIRDEN